MGLRSEVVEVRFCSVGDLGRLLWLRELGDRRLSIGKPLYADEAGGREMVGEVESRCKGFGRGSSFAVLVRVRFCSVSESDAP